MNNFILEFKVDQLIIIANKSKYVLLYLDIIGANILVSKRNSEIIIFRIYYKNNFFKKDKKYFKFYTINIKHNDINILKDYRERLLTKIYIYWNTKKYNANRKLKYLFIINPFSGRKNGVSVFNKYKNLFIAHGINVQYFITKHKDQCLYFIRKAGIEFLEQYDSIICVGGDGIIHEVINGFSQRKDSNLLSNPINNVKIGLIPTGSGCALTENILKINNLTYSIENMIYICLKNREILHSIQKYDILSSTPNINISNKEDITIYSLTNNNNLVINNDESMTENSYEEDLIIKEEPELESEYYLSKYNSTIFKKSRNILKNKLTRPSLFTDYNSKTGIIISIWVPII